MTRLTDPRGDDLPRSIGRLFDDGSTVGWTESQLVERFATARDEAAFAALVERHGPMVLGVCRRFLRDPHDADDAFQAVFLVLARRAGGLRDRELVANWLYGVACRVSRKARATEGRRRRAVATADEPSRLEADARRLPDVDPPGELARRDEWARLHREVERLPARYRVPVVACYFEGKTHEEAAEQFGCPIGTVKGRLARARDLLRRRLEAGGVSPLAVAPLRLLAAPEGRVPVPGPLAAETVRHALAFAASPSVAWTTLPTISLSVRSLTEGALQAMFYAPLKALALPAFVASAGLIVAGSTLASRPAQDAPADGPKAEAPAVVRVGASDRVSPASNRLNDALLSALESYRLSGDRLSADLRTARGDASADRAALERHRDRLQELAAWTSQTIETFEGDPSRPQFVAFRDLLARELEQATADARVGFIRSPATPEDQPASEAADVDDTPAKPKVARGTEAGGGGLFSGPDAAEARRKVAGLAAALAQADENPDSLQLNEALAKPVTLKTAEDSSLGGLLDQIKGLTTADGGKIPVYIDPIGLGEVDASLESPVSIDLEGAPLKVLLRLALKPLGLAYCVRDGVLIISSLEGVRQELKEAELELMGLHPDKVIQGPDGPSLLGGMGQPGGMM